MAIDAWKRKRERKREREIEKKRKRKDRGTGRDIKRGYAFERVRTGSNMFDGFVSKLFSIVQLDGITVNGTVF